jgi:hypothetical protein
MSDHVNLGYNPLMPPSIRIDSSILEAALIGYKHGRNGDRRQDGSDPPSDRPGNELLRHNGNSGQPVRRIGGLAF